LQVRSTISNISAATTVAVLPPEQELIVLHAMRPSSEIEWSFPDPAVPAVIDKSERGGVDEVFVVGTLNFLNAG
jgi:hypothetical protein